MSSHTSAFDPGEGSSTGSTVTRASPSYEEPPIEMVDLAITARDPPTPPTLQPQEGIVEAIGHTVASLSLSAEASNIVRDNAHTPERQSDPESEEQGLEACEPYLSFYID